jgi:hypothetical protein
MIRWLSGIVGIGALGFVVAEILHRWQILSNAIRPLWIALGLLGLFGLHELFHSHFFQTHPRLAPQTPKKALSLMNTLLVILALLAIVSIPFLWYATIESLAQRGTY